MKECELRSKGTIAGWETCATWEGLRDRNGTNVEWRKNFGSRYRARKARYSAGFVSSEKRDNGGVQTNWAREFHAFCRLRVEFQRAWFWEF